MTHFLQRAYHLIQRIIKESKIYPQNKKNFGTHIAKVIFRDGLIPPGKSSEYISQIEAYIHEEMRGFVRNYKIEKIDEEKEKYPGFDKVPVWLCWWQGEESMPELVKMCYTRLKQSIPKDLMELHFITFDNYKDYVTFPEHVMKKYHEKKITMTTLSDMLRFELLSHYGGFWMDATVFFTGEFPKEFLDKPFYSQKMYDPIKCSREACKGRWCGFFMTGYSYNPLFSFVRDAFYHWWKRFDTIVDYVLIDYLILEGYKNYPEIKKLIDDVPDNNVDIFELYQKLNEPYTRELYEELTKNNVIHKLTYKMELHKQTPDGQDTLYGYLLKDVYQNER
ncbi:MAG: capsular polysaccharide synthesis protein [Anaerostipes sp.]|jgi:hypothetical protein